MRKYFGTDGIRGPFNQEPMTPASLVKIAQAFGVFLKSKIKKPKVVIGKDTRISGYTIENALSSGLCSVGVDVFYLGPIPTPGVAYLTWGLRADAGIMISASHNPYYDNGIKLFDRLGQKFPDHDELKIEHLIESDLSKYLEHSDTLGRAKRIDDAIGQYSVFLKETFPKNKSLDGMKIVLDCANGASYRVAPKVFTELGADVITINDHPNGFNINEDCGALHPHKLQEKVLEHSAHVGFAFDGDADRLVVVDETGNVIDGDQTLALCALELKSKNKLTHNGVCVTVMTNKGFDLAMSKHGINCIRTQVGDRYVVEEMRKQNFIFGGESSGHMIFLDSSTTGDGIIAALNILTAFSANKKTKLSELAKVFEPIPQLTKNVSIKNKVPLEKLPKTSLLFKKYEQELEHSGRLMFRYSGTELLARITAEGPSIKRLHEILDDLEKSLKLELNSDSKNKELQN